MATPTVYYGLKLLGTFRFVEFNYAFARHFSPLKKGVGRAGRFANPDSLFFLLATA
jgi:hypothetical protein